MRIVTLNANGIRSAARRGLFEWLSGRDADVVCVQETKAQEHQLGDACYRPAGYHCYYFDARRPGYSGVGIYCRRRPDAVVEGLGIPDIDAEGRYLEARFGQLSVVSFYVPSGSSSEERLAVKFRFLERAIEPLHRLAQSGRETRGAQRSGQGSARSNLRAGRQRRQADGRHEMH